MCVCMCVCSLSQLCSAQNNPNPRVTHFGMTYSEPLHSRCDRWKPRYCVTFKPLGVSSPFLTSSCYIFLRLFHDLSGFHRLSVTQEHLALSLLANSLNLSVFE